MTSGSTRLRARSLQKRHGSLHREDRKYYGPFKSGEEAVIEKMFADAFEGAAYVEVLAGDHSSGGLVEAEAKGLGEIPEEMRDVAETVKREVKSLDEMWYKISVVRTRPYSRLAAIVLVAPEALTSADYCKGAGELEVIDYVRKAGACARAEVKIYRGGSEIEAGDWVAFEPSYAEFHGAPVYEKVVPLQRACQAGQANRKIVE